MLITKRCARRSGIDRIPSMAAEVDLPPSTLNALNQWVSRHPSATATWEAWKRPFEMVAPQNLAVLLQRIDCDVLGSGGINNPVFRHMMGALAADRTGSVAVGTAVTCRPPAQNRSTRSLMRQPWRVRVGSKSSSCRDSTDSTNSAETGFSPVRCPDQALLSFHSLIFQQSGKVTPLLVRGT